MSTTIPVEQAQAKLRDIIHELTPGDVLLITEDQKPIARLIAEPTSHRPNRVPGNCKGMITLLVEDDEHLEGFAEYM